MQSLDSGVLKDLVGIDLRREALDRIPPMGESGGRLKVQLQARLVAHLRYINEHGEDMPEIRNWQWQSDEMDAPKTSHEK